MNSKYLLLLVCLLGFSSLAFAGIDVTYQEVDDNGLVLVDASAPAADPAAEAPADPAAAARLLSGRDYACTFILYTRENLNAKRGLAAFLNVWGPPYDGSIDNLASLSTTPSYFHNLHRIVFQGDKCDCTVTIHSEAYGKGKSINYYAQSRIDGSWENKIDIDYCWAKKAESVSVVCRR